MDRISTHLAALRVSMTIFALFIVTVTATSVKAQPNLYVVCNGGMADARAGSALPATCTYEHAPGYHPTHDGGPWSNIDLLHDSASMLQDLRRPTSNVKPGFDIVHAQICLSDLTVDPSSCPLNYPSNPANKGWGYNLNPQVFGMLENGFQNLRAAGLKVVLRFTYNYPQNGLCESTPPQDAPIDVILRHMRELAPVIQANRDVILALQAGFIGCWGEWHNSTHDNELISHHNAFLDQFTQLFKGLVTLEVRRPYVVLDYARHVYNSIEPAYVMALGLGIHDDFFGMNLTDSNTFLPETTAEDPNAPQYDSCLLRRTTAALARQYSMTGETASEYDFNEPTGCGTTAPSPDSYVAFSHAYSLKTLEWNSYTAQTAYAQKLLEHVGPHLTLEQAVFTKRDDGLSMAVTVHNTGWAAITEGRTAWVGVADQRGSVVAYTMLSGDLGSIEPGESRSITAVLPGRLQRGSYTLFIQAPDNSPRLARNPDYSLLFENADVPDQASGCNTLAYLVVQGRSVLR